MAKNSEWVQGYARAESDLYEHEDEPGWGWPNPFDPNSEAHQGYEEGVYDFTQKKSPETPCAEMP